MMDVLSNGGDALSEAPRKSALSLEDGRRLLGAPGKRLVILPPEVTLRDHGESLRTMRSVPTLDRADQQLVSSPWRNSYSTSISLASISFGSTDGKRVVIRRVPQSPTELLSVVTPHTPTDDDASTSSSGSSYYDPLGEYLHLPRRQHWANKVQFVLACVGYSVGLGNVWRFPYLCYKSGGGAFLVPYFLILIICGIPVLYMELSVGQFTRRGPIGALGQICPLFKGAGLASVVISFIMSTYYNVIIAYAVYYFFTSFKSEIPWQLCGNRWNTQSCWNSDTQKYNFTRLNNSKTPSEEFYENKVLQISNGIEFPGEIRWELAACLLVAWILVYFSIWKGVKSSGKVLYFTATFPYILIIAFLSTSLTLEGANKGLRFFFQPKWEDLTNSKVWVNALAQNFNSLGIAFGSVLSFASYNRYHNYILVDTLAISTINAVTSLLVGIFAFATIGNIATELGRTVDDVISDGPGLVFVVYPQAMAKMPVSQLWAVLFFFMLLCLSLNSQFAIVEVVITSIQDGFPKWVKKHLMCHEMLVLVVCIVSFLFGLPHITQGGIYFFQLVDHYTASISIMILAFFEVIAISWFYGAHRLARNVQDMTGRNPSLYIRFCWWVAAPVLLMAVWVFCLIDYEPPSYNNGAYKYPKWAEILGWMIASLSLVCIPAFAIVVIVRAEGSTFIERLQNSIQSQIQECESCGSDRCEHLRVNRNEPQQEMNTLLTEKIVPLSPS